MYRMMATGASKKRNPRSIHQSRFSLSSRPISMAVKSFFATSIWRVRYTPSYTVSGTSNPSPFLSWATFSSPIFLRTSPVITAYCQGWVFLLETAYPAVLRMSSSTSLETLWLVKPLIECRLMMASFNSIFFLLKMKISRDKTYSSVKS